MGQCKESFKTYEYFFIKKLLVPLMNRVKRFCKLFL